MHGGKRTGAGRPKGSGKYPDVTRVIRVPLNRIDQVQRYLESNGYELPLFGHKVQAGFPSPADDHIETQLDLNTHLIKNPASTFLVRVSGESMKEVGIFPNDILIVDRSIPPSNGKIVIAAIDGELTVKRLKIEKHQVCLVPENKSFEPIVVNELQDLNIWGVVSHVIHSF